MGLMTITDAVRELKVTCGFLIAHPSQSRRLPKWLSERTAAPLDLRQPWWPYQMIEYVDQMLPRPSRVFEYGGGGSSMWLSDRDATLTVVEHHPEWTDRLRQSLPASVELLAVPKTDTGKIRSVVEDKYFDDYVGAIDRFPDNSFDLVIVDGRTRVECALRAMPKVKPGGLLLLDDSDRLRYEPAHKALLAWSEFSVRGLKTGSNVPATSTAWTRPRPETAS